MPSTAHAAESMRSLKVIERRELIDLEAWRHFVQQSPESTAFHTPEFVEVFAQTSGMRPEVIAVFDGPQMIALLVVVQTKILGNWLPKLTSRCVVYGGLLYERSRRGQDALRLATERHDRGLGKKSLFTEVRNSFDHSRDVPILKEMGWTYEEHLNYWLSCHPEGCQDTWKSLRSKDRNNIRRAMKKGVRVEIAQDLDDLEQAYLLLESTYGRARVPLADKSLFQSAFQNLSQDRFEVHLAKHEGRVIGTRFQLYHRDRVFDWFAGSDPNARSLYPNDVLVWHALERGAEKGMQVFDFGGAGRPDEPYGVRDFKAKWKGTLVEHGRFLRVHSPYLMRLSQTGYALLRGAMAPRVSTEIPQ